jgi:hypothetical protein
MLGKVLGELEEAWERRDQAMLRAALWAACCLVLTVVVAFGLLPEDRYVLAIGAVGWALAAALPDSGPWLRRRMLPHLDTAALRLVLIRQVHSAAVGADVQGRAPARCDTSQLLRHGLSGWLLLHSPVQRWAAREIRATRQWHELQRPRFDSSAGKTRSTPSRMAAQIAGEATGGGGRIQSCGWHQLLRCGRAGRPGRRYAQRDQTAQHTPITSYSRNTTF